MAAARWSELPKDLLSPIISRLPLLHDLLQFSHVCSSWRSVAVKSARHLPHRFLGLVAPGKPTHTESRRFFELNARSGDSNNNELLVSKPIMLPVPHRYYCCGSSLGWLVLVDDHWDMQLLDPLSGIKFQLPSSKTLPPPLPDFREFCKFYVNKAVISCDPSPSSSISSSQTIVFVICGSWRQLAFCKLGDKVWTSIESKGRKEYVDAIYHNQKFYAIYNPGGVDVCEIADDSQPRATPYTWKPKGEMYWMTRYLVACKGELYQLRRNIRFDADDPDNDDSDSDYDDDYAWYITQFDDEESVEKARSIFYNFANEGGGQGEVDGHNGDNIDEQGEDDNVEADTNSADNDQHNGSDQSKVDSDDESRKRRLDSLRGYRTVRFKVFKLMKSDGCTCHNKWQKVESIGDNAFFVGYNSSFSVSTLEFKGCKPNSIYFTDSRPQFEDTLTPLRHDIGIFNLEDKSVAPVYPVDDSEPTRPLAFWFTPN